MSRTERQNADLFWADLFGPAVHGLVESVAEDRASTEHREADLFWNDLLGRRPALRARPVHRGFEPSTEFDPRSEESAFTESPPVEWSEADDHTEADDHEDSSLLAEAFGSDHVRISLKNEDGTPAAGVAYRATFRDGHIVNGTLDARGEATIGDHTHGDVQVTFPGLPAASWEVGSFGGSGG